MLVKVSLGRFCLLLQAAFAVGSPIGSTSAKPDINGTSDSRVNPTEKTGEVTTTLATVSTSTPGASTTKKPGDSSSIFSWLNSLDATKNFLSSGDGQNVKPASLPLSSSPKPATSETTTTTTQKPTNTTASLMGLLANSIFGSETTTTASTTSSKTVSPTPSATSTATVLPAALVSPSDKARAIPAQTESLDSLKETRTSEGTRETQSFLPMRQEPNAAPGLSMQAAIFPKPVYDTAAQGQGQLPGGSPVLNLQGPVFQNNLGPVMPLSGSSQLTTVPPSAFYLPPGAPLSASFVSPVASPPVSPKPPGPPSDLYLPPVAPLSVFYSPSASSVAPGSSMSPYLPLVAPNVQDLAGPPNSQSNVLSPSSLTQGPPLMSQGLPPLVPQPGNQVQSSFRASAALIQQAPSFQGQPSAGILSPYSLMPPGPLYSGFQPQSFSVFPAGSLPAGPPFQGFAPPFPSFNAFYAPPFPPMGFFDPFFNPFFPSPQESWSPYPFDDQEQNETPFDAPWMPQPNSQPPEVPRELSPPPIKPLSLSTGQALQVNASDQQKVAVQLGEGRCLVGETKGSCIYLRSCGATGRKPLGICDQDTVCCPPMS